MIIFPNAKINLGLHILERRGDGFHNIETCFYPIGWRDALEIIESDKTVFTSSGLTIPGSAEDNICLKAYRMLQADFDLPSIRIHLHKSIPIGAGLGGGSSDGAHTLKLLSRYFNLLLEEELLQTYAEKLGSDCAFFVKNVPSMGYDKGERLSPVKLNLYGKYVVVVYPDIHVATAEAYSEVSPKGRKVRLEEVLASIPPGAWRDHIHNDFEAGVFKKYPSIQSLKERLYAAGALFAAMTGSGSAVYGIFNEKVTLSFPKSYLHWSGYL